MSLTEKDISKSFGNNFKYDELFLISLLRQNSNLRKFENFSFNPLSTNPTKLWNIHSNNLFEHFVGLILKGSKLFKRVKKCEKVISEMSYIIDMEFKCQNLFLLASKFQNNPNIKIYLFFFSGKVRKPRENFTCAFYYHLRFPDITRFWKVDNLLHLAT